MTYEKKLSTIIQTSYFYKDGSVKMVLKGIEEAIQENYYEAGVYSNVLNGIIQYNRADILEKIYDKFIENKQLCEEIEKRLLSYAFIAKSVEVIELFIDKGFSIKELDTNMVNALVHFPLSTIKKIHEKAYNLNKPNLYLLEKLFNEHLNDFSKIDYLLTIGLKIEDSYIDIIRSCFHFNCPESKDKIDYITKFNIDLNRENNLLLVFALQSNMFELLEHVVSKNIDLVLKDKYIVDAFSTSIRDDDIKILGYIIKKGLIFNMNDPKFVKYLASEDAINLVNYLIPLGLDIEMLKEKAGPKLKKLLTIDLYNKMNNSITKKESHLPKIKI